MTCLRLHCYNSNSLSFGKIQYELRLFRGQETKISIDNPNPNLVKLLNQAIVSG